MIIGVLKEIKEGEKRVALTPAGCRLLVEERHPVLVEEGAGEGSGLTDDEFSREGAEIVPSQTIYDEAELIIKVKEPLSGEWGRFRKGQMLFTYLHLASSEALTIGVLQSGVTGIAYETVEDGRGRLPLLRPMSEVAGRMSIQMAMRFLETDYGGRGILLSGVPGVPPAEVVILGCGIVGFNAAKIASGLGAQVTILDVDVDRLSYVEDILHGYAITMYSNPLSIEKSVAFADVVIGAILVPGARAPVLVTDEMVRHMRPGSVVIDVSVDQGGSVATTRPTTHAEPTYLVHDVIHCAVPNIPASVPRTSTYALTNATLPYVRAIATKGLKRAAEEDPGLAAGINVAKGALTYAAVAEAFDMEWQPWHKML